MTKEEAIEVYHGLINTKIKDAFEFFAPELAESEDERIRKCLLRHFRNKTKPYWNEIAVKDIIAYLEKQKINTEGDFGKGYDCGYQAGYAVAMNEMKPKNATATLATLDSEKQKEQMLKEAVEGVVIDNGSSGTTIDTKYGVLYLPPLVYAVGDKVKIVIVKEGKE